MMHTLAGLDSATGGHIMFDGADITTMTDNQLTMLRRHKIGFIFQSFNLLPMFTAEQNIIMPLTLAGEKPDRAWFDLLVTTLGLKQRLGHRPNELSGGQQQRVAIARALIARPQLVFADEPTGNLDSVSSAEVLSFLRRSVNELGQTIIMVTHDAVAASYADRAIVFADGRIVADETGPGHRLRGRPHRGRRDRPDRRTHEPAAHAGAGAGHPPVPGASRSAIAERGRRRAAAAAECAEHARRGACRNRRPPSPLIHTHRLRHNRGKEERSCGR